MDTTDCSSGSIWKKVVFSSVGKKFVMGITGLSLVGFTITHLMGNFLLLLPTGQAFNAYAQKLADLGPLLLVLEAGLAFFFISHIVNGIHLAVEARRARPSRYQRQESKGGPSRVTWSSVTMPITGFVIFVFLLVHISTMKFGPGIYEGYVVSQEGRQIRDLYRLVNETFQNPLNVGFYVVVMGMLFSHLRHGFWSAFQSLGINHPRYMPVIRCLGFFLALLLAVGFLMIPVYILIAR